MGVRDYLAQREEELLAEMVDRLRQIDALKAELVPLEGELAEVRRAKNAIGIGVEPEVILPSAGIGSFGSAARGFPPEVFIASTPPPGGYFATAFGSTYSSPYDHLTMKELVIKALEEHFQHGATTRQLIDFFRDAWGREIERTNLSPQLSRLYQDGLIGRIRSMKGWFLIPQVELGGRWPYRRPTGEIIWMHPAQATADVEGLVMRNMHDDEPPDEY